MGSMEYSHLFAFVAKSSLQFKTPIIRLDCDPPPVLSHEIAFALCEWYMDYLLLLLYIR